MSLAKKYGITEATIKNMINDGVLPCSVVRSEEAVNYYNIQLDKGLSKSEAVQITALQMNLSIQHIYRIIKKY